MNNNVIYYNMEEDLVREELYLASVCVLAAKRAAADWCRKNGVPVRTVREAVQKAIRK